MTSTHSGPYKSKLFNFIANQYRKVADQFDRGLNQVKRAAATSAQIIIYPIYVAIQTTRLSLKGLRQQAQKLIPQKSSFVNKTTEEISGIEAGRVEEPVGKVLDAATELVNDRPAVDEGPKEPTEEVRARARNKYIRSRFWEVKTRRAEGHRGMKSNTKTVPYRVIVGIACSLENRNLVLVTSGNKVLDVLSEKRQQQLNRRILLETLRYQRDRRLKEQLEQKLQPRKLQPSARLAYKQKGPSHLWWQMLAWMESSGVAVKANLFEESALVSTEEEDAEKETGGSLVVYNSNKDFQKFAPEWQTPDGMPRLQPLACLTQSSLLPFLDRAIAALEKGEIALALETTAKAATSATQWQSPTPKSEKLLPKSKVPTEGVWQNVIHQYIYPMAPLFGLKVREELEEVEEELEGRSRNPVFLKNRVSEIPEELEENLLASQPAQRKEVPLEKQDISPTSSPWKIKEEKATKYSAPEKKQPTSSKRGKHPRWQLTETGNVWANISLSVPQNQSKTKSVSKLNPQVVSNTGEKKQSDKMEYKPDFLEADSISVGYVKHPLELLLEWLDLAMLRLEESILQISQWLHEVLFRSK